MWFLNAIPASSSCMAVNRSLLNTNKQDEISQFWKASKVPMKTVTDIEQVITNFNFQFTPILFCLVCNSLTLFKKCSSLTFSIRLYPSKTWLILAIFPKKKNDFPSIDQPNFACYCHQRDWMVDPVNRSIVSWIKSDSLSVYNTLRLGILRDYFSRISHFFANL